MNKEQSNYPMDSISKCIMGGLIISFILVIIFFALLLY